MNSIYDWLLRNRHLCPVCLSVSPRSRVIITIYHSHVLLDTSRPTTIPGSGRILEVGIRTYTPNILDVINDRRHDFYGFRTIFFAFSVYANEKVGKRTRNE